MNTQINYLYRDGANHKKPGHVVLAGLPAIGLKAFEAALKEVLDDGEYFIADQIKVPEVFLWAGGYKLNEDDHSWHVFSDAEETADKATDERTPEEFLASVSAAKAEGWKEFDPASR